LALLALASLAAGCGEGAGVAKDATLSAYAEAPLCAGASRELASADGRAGSFHVQLLCLPGGDVGGRLDLAAVGAGARRASEDSASIAYLGVPATRRFSQTILETPGIPGLYGASGGVAMADLLAALAEADPDSLRDSVSAALEQPRRSGSA
jgi:hypothetical protein